MTQKTRSPIQWRPLDEVIHLIPEALRDLMKDESSMTKRMKESGRFELTLLYHDWGKPTLDENRALNYKNQTLIREVKLSSHQLPKMFARAVIPESTMKREGEQLLKLGSKPLGEILFADPNLVRSPFEVMQLKPKHPLFEKACAAIREFERPDYLWARRSVFQYLSRPLLLSEVFYDFHESLD